MLAALIIYDEDILVSPSHQEHLREYLLNLMSCGISKFGFVFKESGDNNGICCGNGSVQGRAECSEDWDYCREIEAVLHSKISCRVYHELSDDQQEVDASAPSLIEVLKQAAENVLDVDETTTAATMSEHLNLLCCQVSSSSAATPCPNDSVGHFEYLFAHCFDKRCDDNMAVGVEDVCVISKGSGDSDAVVSTAKIVNIKRDLSNIGDALQSMIYFN